MPNNLRTLQEELDTGGTGPFTAEPNTPELPSPVVYSADDQTAANELNALTRPAPIPLSEYLLYFMENTHRLEIGTDQYTRLSGAVGPATSLYARLVEVVTSLDWRETTTPPTVPPSDPTSLWPRFWIQENANRADPANANGHLKPLDKDEVHRCLTLFKALQQEAAIDLGAAGNQQILTGGRDALVLTQAQIAEILGRGNNRQSRATEIAWRFIQWTDVRDARALNGP